MTLTTAEQRFLATLVAQGYQIPPLGRGPRVDAWHKTARELKGLGLITLVRLRNANAWEAQLARPVPLWVFQMRSPPPAYGGSFSGEETGD
jgi:hypothetical protein